MKPLYNYYILIFFFKKRKDKKVKQVLSGDGYQWEGVGIRKDKGKQIWWI
jgi:hypothetical protein